MVTSHAPRVKWGVGVAVEAGKGRQERAIGSRLTEIMATDGDSILDSLWKRQITTCSFKNELISCRILRKVILLVSQSIVGLAI